MILNTTDRKKQLKIYLRQSISNAIFRIKFPFETVTFALLSTLGNVYADVIILRHIQL